MTSTCEANFWIPSQSSQDDIESLIVQLGSDEFSVRSKAESEIQKLGSKALQPLRDVVALRSKLQPDNEVRLRAKRLLILIERESYEKKVQQFLAGEQNEIDLYGWESFSKIVGADRTARQIFVAMHESQPELLQSLTQSRQAAEEEHQDIVRRYLRVSNYSNANQVIGTLTAVLFAATQKLKSQDDASPAQCIIISDYNLSRMKSVMIQPQMLTFIESTGNKSQLKNLISHWLDFVVEQDAKTTMLKLEIINAYQLDSKVDMAIKAIQERELPKSTRILALQVLEKLGDENAIEGLEKAFEDTTLLGKYFSRPNETKSDADKQPTPMEVKFCDLALLVCIQIKKLNPVDFGFETAAIVNNKFVSNSAGFRSDETRSEAFKLWKKLHPRE